MNLKHKLLALAIMSSPLAFADEEQPMQLENDTTSTSQVNALNEENATGETLVEAPPVQPQNIEPEKNFASAWGVAIGAGSLGVSFNLAHALYDDYLDVRAQYNYFPISSLNFDDNVMNARFNTIGLLVDYKPFGGVFRITGGVYGDGRKLDISGNNIDINGTSASGNAGLQFPAMSPYIGIGLGSYAATTESKKGFLIAFDAGVMISKASAYANVTCNGDGADSCKNFDQDVQNFIDDANSTFAAFPLYPVVSLNLGYRF